MFTHRWQHLSASNDLLAAILKLWRQIENQTPSVGVCSYVKNISVNFHPDPTRIWRNKGFLEERRPNNNNDDDDNDNDNNKMSSDMRSVSDLKHFWNLSNDTCDKSYNVVENSRKYFSCFELIVWVQF